MNEKSLTGKKIVLFSWPFYQYPNLIKETLEKLGGEVSLYLSAPSDNFLKVRFLERFEGLKKKYFDNIIQEIEGKQFDYVFMINTAVFPKSFLKKLNKVCRDSCKILYSWDSIAVYPKAKELYEYFDYVYSFDSKDVEELPNLKFLPLFFCDDLYDAHNIYDLKYDFSFVGFGHTERYKFIKQIEKFANKNHYSYFLKLYLPSKIHFFRGKYLKRNFPEAKADDFIYKPIAYEELKKVTNQSRIVVDLELSNQTGLTMRTIETHGMRKKLITTNMNIKKYDFFNENNILIVDRKKPIIPESFVESDYEMLSENLYEKYSLSNWLKEIFKV